ncbi:acetyl-CoA carboxylase biotin carboxylase subunit [Pseudaquidulcibacter saccharophilus]|uniref:acetyl-CoA carboxylase biotin carboxylase subunit n=1 Tax=Pseudaquidulcibacter saccharophilus TaxID=2831900 RepID=UPI001EFF48D6|nr:acetyl/propionyl/methylcrotonyl-CoA carboxylase subunit alpha [Pseudaquidulcibacter saccharophilus]
MFNKILIANRGEIAVRVIKTARRMGIKTVVVYSDADAGSLAVEMADEKVHIGPSPAAQSYLVADKIIAACKETGAEAVHPGFGFLSENQGFAQRLKDEGIVFIGPNPYAIGAMGDKIESKKAAQAAGVSCVPGFIGEIRDTEHALEISKDIGYPVMIKASAGGGGKGIRIAYNDQEVLEGFPAVKAEAIGAFGDDRIFIEKFITAPRHIEIQILGDKHGNVVYLFERECSIQRRNQKVIEEAPSPLLDEVTRKKMGEQAVALAKAVNYDSAGTVEFVASGVDKSFYFLEMNTRLQVEHPVTEMITGLDLVEQMIRVAYGEALSFKQEDLKINGWAMESRVYAEDPYRGFLPSIGRLRTYKQPVEGELLGGKVRVDSGVREGDEISMHYDPMIAKLICWNKDRISAIETSLVALDEFAIKGIQSNTPFVSAIMGQDLFRSGDITTAYIGKEFKDGFHGVPLTDKTAKLFTGIAALVHTQKRKKEMSTDVALHSLAISTRSARKDWAVAIDGDYHQVHVEPNAEGAVITYDDGSTLEIKSNFKAGEKVIRGFASSKGLYDNEAFTINFEDLPQGFKFHYRGITETVIVATPRMAELHAMLPEKEAPDTSGLVISPMPGLVVSIDVAVGDAVKSGQAIAIIEAMKMQNIIRAERDGTIKAIKTAAGAAIAADEIMIELD